MEGFLLPAPLSTPLFPIDMECCVGTPAVEVFIMFMPCPSPCCQGDSQVQVGLFHLLGMGLDSWGPVDLGQLIEWICCPYVHLM